MQEALDEYTKRLQGTIQIDWILAKSDKQLEQLLANERHYICLDPKGKAFSSEEFSKAIYNLFLKEGSRLQFVIGGAEGIPASIKNRAGLLISFSPMTFTHQMTRLIFLEQLYRAVEIQKGSSYHK